MSKGPEVGSEGHFLELVAAEEQDEVRKLGPDKMNKAECQAQELNLIL